MSEKSRFVIDLIRKGIEAFGADGLVNNELECGCGKDDLCPCDEPGLHECELAKIEKCPTGLGEWYVSTEGLDCIAELRAENTKNRDFIAEFIDGECQIVMEKPSHE